MMTDNSAAAPDEGDALANLQADMGLIITRVRARWRESALELHPDLQPVGYKLLVHIARAGGTHAHRLAGLFDMDKSAISRQTTMLESCGLIESRPDEADGRLRVLTATPLARGKLKVQREEHVRLLREALADVSEEDLRTASRIIRMMAHA